MLDKHVAFYTSRPFWVESPPDLRNPDVLQHFYDHLSEIKFTFESELFTVKICRDGMILLKVNWLEDEIRATQVQQSDDLGVTVTLWNKYLNYINVLQFFVEVSILEKHQLAIPQKELTRDDIFRVHSNGYAIPPFSIAYYHHDQRRLQVSDLLAFKEFPETYFQLRIPGKYSFPSEVFELACQKFEVTASDNLFIELLTKLFKSLCQHRLGDYANSLLIAWFIVEAIIDKKWEQFLNDKDMAFEDGKRRVNGDRRNVLSGRDYPISVKSNILELSEVFSYPLFEKINKVRKNRNDIVHQDSKYTCTAEQAELAVELALELLLENRNLTIPLAWGIQMMSL